MRPSQPVPQQPDRSDIDQADSDDNQNLSKRDVGVIVGSTIGGLSALTIIAWLLLPVSSVIVPFVVASALPLFTLFAIIYQAVVYRRQWYAMRAALKQTDRVIAKMQEQLSAMGQQEKALREQSKLMGDSIVISNMAAVGVHSIEYDKHTGLICIRIENIGLVAAERLTLFLQIIIGFHNRYVDAEPTATSVRGLLRYEIANQEYGSTKLLRGNLQIAKTFDLRGHLRERELDLVVQGHANLSVRGRVGYEDGFMQGRQQTNFFFWYNHRSNAWTPDDPEKWGAHFDVSIADNEEWQGETGKSQKNPH